MPRPQHSGFETWLRGGQTVGHNFDMTVEVLGKMLLLMITPMLIAVIVWTVHCMSPTVQLAGSYDLEAKAFHAFRSSAPQKISVTSPDGTTRKESINDIATDPELLPQIKTFWWLAGWGAVMFLVLSVGIGVGTFFWLACRKGLRQNRPLLLVGESPTPLGSGDQNGVGQGALLRPPI